MRGRTEPDITQKRNATLNEMTKTDVLGNEGQAPRVLNRAVDNMN